jgi:hypothetical protein
LVFTSYWGIARGLLRDICGKGDDGKNLPAKLRAIRGDDDFGLRDDHFLRSR